MPYKHTKPIVQTLLGSLILSFALELFAYPALEMNGKISDDFYEVCSIVAKELKISLPHRNAELNEWNQWAQKYLLRDQHLDHQDIIHFPKSQSHQQLMPLFKKCNYSAIASEIFTLSAF